MPGPFRERFLGVVEPLFGRRFSANDGYSEEELDAITERCEYELPEALRDFYSLVGKFDPIMQAHNTFYAPDRLTRIDGRLAFCEENQVVVYWGYDQDEGWRSDPAVLQGVNSEEVEWHLEAERCSDFLIGMTYWQALFGGLPYQRFQTAATTVRETAATWPLVWKDEETQVFSRGNIVFSLTDATDGVDVQAAALYAVDIDNLWHALNMPEFRTKR